MSPKLTPGSGIPTNTIYINPNFTKNETAISTSTHINPNFLLSRSSAVIHLNPNFLQRNVFEQQKTQIEQQQQYLLQQRQMHEMQSVLLAPTSSLAVVESNVPAVPNDIPSCQIIPKSSMRIVRDSVQKPNTTVENLSPYSMINPMVKLGQRTLLRKNLLRDTTSIAAKARASTRGVGRTVSTVGPKAKYKIDRRQLQPSALTLEKTHRSSFVARYALRRTNNSCTVRKPILSSSPKVSTFRISRIPPNKKLQMLNINGVLYKSTRTKLQRKDSSHSAQMSDTEKPISLKSQKDGSARTVIVRGARFVLDKQGYKLTRVSDKAATLKSLSDRQNAMRRIDIGGLTYVATSRNVFVRTSNHLVRSHVNIAKHRSVQLLTRSLVASNVPCPIYQRVGKCSAFERGRCRKVHDRRQVAICSKFLLGECKNTRCLLSHEVSLAKMPVCKFFLQGICVRSDCVYLHKKVSRNTEICTDFLRGYCSLAEQCNKRHEFLCPDYERNGKCEKRNCGYCKKKRQEHKLTTVATQRKNQHLPKDHLEKASEDVAESGPASVRYFITGCNERDQTEQGPVLGVSAEDSEPDLKPSKRPSRPKLGILPAYIPLS